MHSKHRRRIGWAAPGAAALVLSTALIAAAVEDDGDYRWGSDCTVGSDTRPAVTWRARQGDVEVTPPGTNYVLNYSTGTNYHGLTNGGIMDGGWWYVLAQGDLDALRTFGSCTAP